MRVAVVDIGTNSTRLLIADVAPGGAVAERVRESTVTRLGEGVDTSGRLGDAPQQRVFATLERYAADIRAHECEASTAVMTSAVRDAANGAEFSAAVRERFRLEGRTLSGDEEAAFTYAGATAARPAGRPHRAGRDRHRRRVDRAGLRRRGAARVPRLDPDRRRAPHRAPPALRPAAPQPSSPDWRPTSTQASAPRCPATCAARTQAAVAVAGTATSCAAIDLALEHYDTTKVEGHVLSRARLDGLLERLAALPLSERRGVRGLDPDRAPTIVAGVVILGSVLDAFGLGEVEVSDHDILWGVARALAR